MKLGDRYIIRESISGPELSYYQDEVVTLTEKNWGHMEGLIRSGVAIETEEVSLKEVAEALEKGDVDGLEISSDPEPVFLQKKSDEENPMWSFE